MKTSNLIAVEEFCIHYKVPKTFILTLKEYELIEISTIAQQEFIREKEIRRIEKLMRLHYDLQINFEGLDAIYNLLEKIDQLEEQILHLRNKLNRYEDF